MCMTRHVVSGLGWAWLGVPGCHTGRDYYIFFGNRLRNVCRVSLSGWAGIITTTWVAFVLAAFSCFSLYRILVVPLRGTGITACIFTQHFHKSQTGKPAIWRFMVRMVSRYSRCEGWMDSRIDNARQCRLVKGQRRETRQPEDLSVWELWDRRLHERYLKRLCVYSGAGSWADYDDTMLYIPTTFTESRLRREEKRPRRARSPAQTKSTQGLRSEFFSLHS